MSARKVAEIATFCFHHAFGVELPGYFERGVPILLAQWELQEAIPVKSVNNARLGEL